MTLKAMERLQILRKDAQGACILALQETRILIGLGLTMGARAALVQSAPRFYPIVVLHDEIKVEPWRPTSRWVVDGASPIEIRLFIAGQRRAVRRPRPTHGSGKGFAF